MDDVSLQQELLPRGGGGWPPGPPAPYKKTDQGLSVSLVFSIAPPKKS